ncbi:hypothetical protein ACFQ07_27025, partial [Actinomadura adrarensis]
MLVAHATWHYGALCVWAERTGPFVPGDVSEAPTPHPFATRDFAGTSYEGLVGGAARVELTMTLPSFGGVPCPSS